MNPPTHQVLFIGKEFELLEVGNYIVTSEDEAANCRWRRKFKCNDLAMPMTDGARFTEAWRIPAPPVKPPQYRFKTVCRILSIEINNGPKSFAKKVILAARHLALRVQVFARPADIGEAHTCPYEVIETDQGNFQIYGVSTTLCFIFTSAKIESHTIHEMFPQSFWSPVEMCRKWWKWCLLRHPTLSTTGLRGAFQLDGPGSTIQRNLIQLLGGWLEIIPLF